MQVRRARAAGGAGSSEEGFTLVELMLAILLLGLLLTGTAATLISFLRASLVNESRVQATSHLNELHEELQATSWDQLALYEEEIGPLQDLGVNPDGSPPEYDGEELVLLDGPNTPGCDPDEDASCDRHPFVPLAHEVIHADGREYETYRVIASSSTHPDIKRITTVIRWEVLGKEVEERFQSLRAPRISDIEETELPDVLTFDVTPSSSPLTTDGANEQEISIDARFSRPIDGAEIRYVALDDDDAHVERSMSLTGTLFEGSRPKHFEGTIDAGDERFPAGTQSIELVGLDGGTEIPSTTQIELTPADGSGSTPPDVGEPSASPTSVNVGSHGGEMQCTLTVSVPVYGLESEGTVTAKYTAGPSEGVEMSVVGSITGDWDTFRLTFDEGSSPPWSDGGEDHFTITARNPGGPESPSRTTGTISFNRNNGNCG